MSAPLNHNSAAAQREFLLASMRVAAGNLRTWQLEIEFIGTALRNDQMSLYTACEWLDDIGLLPAKPITGRGIGYKLFTAGLIPSMATSEMQRVYRLLKEARERGVIPWAWIVDETRELERKPTWDDPAALADVARSYRRDFWNQQPLRSRCGARRAPSAACLAPVLNSTASASGSCTVSAAQRRSTMSRKTMMVGIWSYSTCGDYDPSGMWMSERDLPERLARYGGDHVRSSGSRSPARLAGLPSFPAADKRKTPIRVVLQNSAHRCWELDAMDPNDSARARRERNHRPDRADRMEPVRRGEQGRAGVAADGSRPVGGGMNPLHLSNEQSDKLIDLRDRRPGQGAPLQDICRSRHRTAPKRHIFKGVMARGETSAWIAPPGGMKSALMASAAMCGAYGIDWFGKRNKERVGVVSRSGTC